MKLHFFIVLQKEGMGEVWFTDEEKKYVVMWRNQFIMKEKLVFFFI